MMKGVLKKEAILNFIGVIFLIIAINQFFVLFFIVKNPTYLIWFSDHVAFLLALGILMRKRILVTAELCIALIPEIIWSLDFLSKLIFNKYLFGVTGVAQYLFSSGVLVTKWQNLSSIQHLFIVPLGLTALWIMKADKNGWKLAIIHGLIIWFLSLSIGQSYNLNCVFRLCISAAPSIKNYMIIWPITAFCLIIISGFFIQKIFRPKSRKN